MSMLYQQRSVSNPPYTAEVRTVGGPRVLEYTKYGFVYTCPYGSPVVRIAVPMKERLFEFRRRPARTRRSKWNPFEHYKRSTEYSTFGTDTNWYGQANTWLSSDTPLENWQTPYLGTVSGDQATLPEFEVGGAPMLGLFPLYSPEVVDGETYYRLYEPPNLENWKADSLVKMLPTIKGELSLINSLLELKDFTSLPRTLDKINAFNSRFKIQELFKMKKATLKELLRTGADGYLQAKFNIIPLLSDIKAIYNALTTYATRADALLANAGKVQVKHFRFAWHDPNLTDSDVLHWSGMSLDTPFHCLPNENNEYESGPNFSAGAWRRVEVGDVKFHAQVKYTYVYNDFQRAHARMFTLLDTLGVNLNPAIIWNATPWSFVVDWVVGVSRWLNKLRIGNMDPKIDVLRYCWSYSVNRKVEVRVPIHNHFVYDIPPEALYDRRWNTVTPVSTTYETVYNRGTSLPSLGSLQTSGLNLSEISLATALGITRKRKHKRWRTYAR